MSKGGHPAGEGANPPSGKEFSGSRWPGAGSGPLGTWDRDNAVAPGCGKGQAGRSPSHRRSSSSSAARCHPGQTVTWGSVSLLSQLLGGAATCWLSRAACSTSPPLCFIVGLTGVPLVGRNCRLTRASPQRSVGTLHCVSVTQGDSPPFSVAASSSAPCSLPLG